MVEQTLSKIQIWVNYKKRGPKKYLQMPHCFICTQVQGPYQSTDGDSVLGVWCQTLKSLVS